MARMGMTKTCFKCFRVLSLSEFYRHPQMADGLLGKCKSCTKADTAARVQRKAKDPAWVENEMERHRIKQRKARARGTACVFRGEKRRMVHLKHRRKYPEKYRAREVTQRALHKGILLRLPCQVCGSLDSEAHHENYSNPLQIMWLCPKHHAERHVELRRQKRLQITPA